MSLQQQDQHNPPRTHGTGSLLNLSHVFPPRQPDPLLGAAAAAARPKPPSPQLINVSGSFKAASWRHFNKLPDNHTSCS